MICFALVNSVPGAPAPSRSRALDAYMCLAALVAAALVLTSPGAWAQSIDQSTRVRLFGQSPVAAGIYQIRVLHSQQCLGYRSTVNTRLAHLETGLCSSVGFGPGQSSLFMVLPHPAGSFTIRPLLPFENGGARRSMCATDARGVVLGPNAVDVVNCDVPDRATSWCSAGSQDQRHSFQRLAPNLYRISSIGQANCWDIRDASLNLNAEVILFECHEGANQRFELLFQGTVDAADEVACAGNLGWVQAPDGLRRAVPVEGVNLYGADYDFFPTPTASDCATACVNDTRCRGFSWVRQSGICWVKEALPEPSPDPSTVSGIVRP